MSRVGRNASFACLAARTRFFDDAVVEALDEGLSQVGVIGAGYDSRAWRLARPGVHDSHWFTTAFFHHPGELEADTIDEHRTRRIVPAW